MSPRHMRRASPSSSQGAARGSSPHCPVAALAGRRFPAYSALGAPGPRPAHSPAGRASHPHRAGGRPRRSPPRAFPHRGLPVAPSRVRPHSHRPQAEQRGSSLRPRLPAHPFPHQPGSTPTGRPTLPRAGPGPAPRDASTHLGAAPRVLAAHALGQRAGVGSAPPRLAACAVNEAAVQPPLCARRGPACCRNGRRPRLCLPPGLAPAGRQGGGWANSSVTGPAGDS